MSACGNLHDAFAVCLQEYIGVLEHISEARRREVLSLKADMRRSESESRRLYQSVREGPAHGDLFCGKESSVLPSKLRAIVEDNRVLKEKARKFRERWTRGHEELAQAQKQSAHMRTELTLLKADLRRCTISPDEVQALKVRE